MADTLRGHTLTISAKARLVTETCIDCGTVFGIAEHLYDWLRKNGHRFYCPNGHHMIFTQGKSDEQKLREANAALQAKDDQLRAAIREGDRARQETLRIRSRIANGVCPCCTRSFTNVRHHMATQHPEFAIEGDWKHNAGPFTCSCGRKLETFQGLRVHQARSRGDDWDEPDQNRYWSHLTVV
jgi:hypothetical protein